MRITGARIATGPRSAEQRDITVHDQDETTLDFSRHLLLPGLINAHDHLEFSTFPRLGNRIYANARQWADDIYHPDQSPVRENLAIPKAERLYQGGLRNLRSGATTVAHHNPYDAVVFDNNFPVRVVRDFGWAHSLGFEKDIVMRCRNTPEDRPFVVHAAEGTDANAASEIARLDELGVLGPRTVLVHAIATGSHEIALLRKRGCSIVWCPESNLNLYNKTLSHDVLQSGIPIALGTDSPLTSSGDLCANLRLAYSLGVTPEDLYRMVTTVAASIFCLRDEVGVADFVAVEDRGQTPAEALLDLRPRMVMVGGRIKLCEEAGKRVAA